MIEVSDLRLEQHGEWTRLVCGVSFTEVETPFTEKTMWFALKNEEAWMFSTDVYDPFVLLPFYLGMLYGTDVHIRDKVSKELYRNVSEYISGIFDAFSKRIKRVRLEVDGFGAVTGAERRFIGTGCSGGADDLFTIYKCFVEETDPEYRINHLFSFNFGWCGHYEDEKTIRLFRAQSQKAERNRFLLPQSSK